MERASNFPDVDDWEHRPLLLFSNPKACGGTLKIKIKGCEEDSNELSSSPVSCPIGIPFEFESDLFVGKLLFRVRNLDNSANVEGDRRYFENRNRKNQYVVQGRFKKEIPARKLLFGSEYRNRLKLEPPVMVEAIIKKLFRKVNASVEMKLRGENPYVLGSFACGVQKLRGDDPGEEPDIESLDIEENNAAFSKNTRTRNGIDWPVDIKKRKLYFKDPKKSEGFVFDTETIYTFEYYDNFFDYGSNCLHLAGLMNIGLEKIIQKETMQVVGIEAESRQHLWSFDLWHEKNL